jgi:hypothetical protein
MCAVMKKAPGAISAGLAVSAATTAGIALWLSRASFDVAGTSSAPERVAMLPSPAELMGFVVIALLVSAGMALMLRKRGDRTSGFWEPARDALLPLFGLSLLVLPYLPWVTDWIPALRLLAGPGRFVVWVVVIGQVLWMLLPQLSPSKAAAIFGGASVMVSAPFVLNVPNLPTAVVDVFHTVRQLPSTSVANLPAGSLGVLFDQEYGIFPFAPVLFLGFVGLAGMMREPDRRRLSIALSVTSVLLIVLAGTLDPWWSKSAMPGEQLILMLPLLAPPLAWLYARLPRESLSRAGAQLLLLVSLAVTLVMVLADSVPVRQEADGSSGVLQWMSPTWQLWSEAPSYVVNGAAAATVRVALWLAVSGCVWWVISRRSTSSIGRSALTVTTGAALLFIAVVSATSHLLSVPSRQFDVEGRALFPLLETFDPVARPIAVRYDPFSIVSPSELPPLFTASAVPGKRTDPQPLRVVLNARFRLPAGEYVLDLKGSESAATVPHPSIALQIGREGRPLEAWPLALVPGQQVQHGFRLPLDAEFVGFRASRQVEEAIAELRVSPVSVVEVRRRFRAPTVLAAAAFPPARVFFHDGNAYPEREGFWAKGRETTRMTFQKANETDTGILLAVHSGARPNIVTLATSGWSQKLELVPGVTERVLVPTVEGQPFFQLTVTSSDGFVPAEIEASRDRRLLGAWVGFIRDDISKTSVAP